MSEREGGGHRELNRAEGLPLGWLILVLLALPTLAHVNGLQGDFVFDGVSYIERNASLDSLDEVVKNLEHPRYVSQVSLAINRQISGTDTWSYHVVNIAIHLVNTLLAFDLIRITLGHLRWSPSNATYMAFAAALLWACHPLQTQAVTYIYQRPEALASMFYLGAVWGFARSQPENRPGWLIFSILCCLLGFRTKLIIASAPLVIFLYDRVVSQSSWREIRTRRWWYYGPFLLTSLIALAWIVLRKAELEAVGIGSGDGVPTPWEYLFNQPLVLLKYISLWFAPVNQAIAYDWPPGRSSLVVGAAMLVLAALLLTAWDLRNRRPWAFLSAWFVLILAPTSSVVPIRHLIFEHRAYLPSLALAVGSVLIIRRLFVSSAKSPSTRPYWLTVIVVWACVLAGITHDRNRDYYDRLTMWTDNASKQPGAMEVQINLADELIRRTRYEEALAPARQAVEFQPDNQLALNNYGIVLMHLGQAEAAKVCFQRSISQEPTAQAYVNLANLERGSSPIAAIAFLRKALALNPRHSESHNNLGALLKQTKNDLAAAEEHYRLAIRHDPNNTAPKKNLAILLAESGRLGEAIEMLRQVLRQTPEDTSAAHNLRVLESRRAG